MHKYDHHIGDYDRDTGHLTLLEHGIYRRLLDRVYADERPLPLDVVWICRKVGARTKPEKSAVQGVLNEFFDLRETGYHSKRAEKELEGASLRVRQAQYGMVKRFWDKETSGAVPTFEQFEEHPEWYRHPINHTIGDYRPTNSPLLPDPTESNTNLPPSAFRLPPSTKGKPPVVPQGGPGGAAVDSLAKSEGQEFTFGDSGNSGSRKKEEGGAVQVLSWSAETSWVGVTADLIGELDEVYPACNIRRQFLAMDQWLKANPKRAVKSNWRQFANNWLRKEQDRGGDLRFQGGAKKEGAANSEDAFAASLGGGQ